MRRGEKGENRREEKRKRGEEGAKRSRQRVNGTICVH
jgi:hypothetical protein